MAYLAKIINYRYQDQAADLISAKPTGPIQGFHLNNLSNNQSWTFINQGGEFFYLKNGSTGTYASIASEFKDAPIVGNSAPYIWKLTPIDGGWYQIQTLDGRFAWLLTGPGDYAPIVLVHAAYRGTDAQWAYRPTADVK